MSAIARSLKSDVPPWAKVPRGPGATDILRGMLWQEIERSTGKLPSQALRQARTWPATVATLEAEYGTEAKVLMSRALTTFRRKHTKVFTLD